ncbi:unnamed protein product [Rotaria socialis]|uniref:Uncharacterized protein n=1 Tax=Rotaria socialis TaxID=392032 RepID=A0A820WJP1_9BILA|nr:unnamed protein product [Rotaria socialis]CAF4518154.1 unnamed protein product [Rotaria socialis]
MHDFSIATFDGQDLSNESGRTDVTSALSTRNIFWQKSTVWPEQTSSPMNVGQNADDDKQPNRLWSCRRMGLWITICIATTLILGDVMAIVLVTTLSSTVNTSVTTTSTTSITSTTTTSTVTSTSSSTTRTTTTTSGPTTAYSCAAASPASLATFSSGTPSWSEKLLFNFINCQIPVSNSELLILMPEQYIVIFQELLRKKYKIAYK